MINNLEVFSRGNKHSKHGKWYSAQGLGRSPAKNHNTCYKTESGNPKNFKTQTQSGKILYNVKLAITLVLKQRFIDQVVSITCIR